MAAGDAGLSRIEEARKACEILKARPLYAGHANSEAVVDKPHYEAFRKLVEAERPDAVFTHWPIDNHADHRAISMLVYDAWLRLGKKFALYYYEVSNGEDTLQFAPTHFVDITATAPRKRLACYAHASQAPTSSMPCNNTSHACEASRAATRRQRGISVMCKARTSPSRWFESSAHSPQVASRNNISAKRIRQELESLAGGRAGCVAPICVLAAISEKPSGSLRKWASRCVCVA